MRRHNECHFKLRADSKWGLLGAAIATLITYVCLTYIKTCVAFKYLSFKIGVKEIMIFTVFSFLMAFSINLIHSSHCLLNIILKISLGMLVYSSLLLIFFKNIRRLIISKLVAVFSLFSNKWIK
jgi:hypothetical protein